jgi:hypothetical protein
MTIVDVAGDGNCGSRAIAVCLGEPETSYVQVKEATCAYLSTEAAADIVAITSLGNFTSLHCLKRRH